MYTEEIELFLEDFKENLEKSKNHLQDELIQIRAGRANPRIVERVMVDYYGTLTPLNQMATISAPEPRMVMVSLWDISMIKAASKAIEAANLGLNPSDDGRVIRLLFPILTEERRRELMKDVNKLVEAAKVTCRNARRDVLDEFKKLKKDGAISEDDYDRLEKDIQLKLDAMVQNIDKMQAAKEKDIMEI